MGACVEVRGLSAKRGSFLLDDVSLKVADGEVFAILGQTGSGKTVLLEAIAGAFRPDSGAVLIEGLDVSRFAPGDRGVGVVFQDYALFPHMTVLQNVRYGLDRMKVPRSEANARALDMLEHFDIGQKAHQYPGSISGGEAQRAALARALVLEPSVLLMDEPFAAVDPATKRRLYETVRQIHCRFGCTILFVTHDFDEAISLADNVGVVLGGKLRLVCPSSDLFNRAIDEDVRFFLGLEE